ncbi:sugar ABC transporter substrate-binding protein [Acrocarpospora macrocephala]|uniref:Sugar ABC transporter substrate-binding protein n=1 Tax=Acrocarpospora macrocephala TaxID=150177 RepID=A0A5M3WR03_9ACTN|nr:sugar ABC transporter substrate-binding protein [Acrocarpospora macrocephala]GES11735.1 sugar ABC transporter substrate-binding protein [Acrocarpospora macrocephala]
MERKQIRRRLARRRLSSVTLPALALLASAGLALSACTSGATSNGGSSGTTGAAPSAPGASTAGGTISIFVIGGKSDDPFWSKVKRGVDDAAKVVQANGGKVTWLGPQNYDNLGPDAAKLILTAKSQGATAVIGADWVPDAQDEAFKSVSDSGVPVFLYNSGGADAAKTVGALTYTGSDELLAGKVGGQFFAQKGVKNVLCVNTLPGAVNTEARCEGISQGISVSGKSTQLPLPSSSFGNPTAITQAIKATLLKDSSIDGIVTISTQDADSASAAIEQADAASRVKLGTFDMDDTQLERIKAGTQLFCIDQQPYMQGYLAVSQAFAYNAYGLLLPQSPLLTGPAVINAGNVDQALAGAKAGVR